MTSMYCYKLWLFHTDTGDQTWVLIPVQLEKYEKNLKKANRMFTRVHVPHFSVSITRAGHSLLLLT